MPDIPSTRYLVPFHPKKIPHYFTDVLVIGSGLAGLRAAIAVDPKLSVLIVSKDEANQSASAYAQGGVAGVLDPDDRFEYHVRDTLKAGGTLCDRDVVDMVVQEAPQRIRELAQWGTRFDEKAGDLVLGREGGHDRPRVAHALGDATGKEIIRAVLAWVRRLRNVIIWEKTFSLDLLTDEGACRGALVVHPQHGLILVWAKQTVLCTGGAGQIYRESTNPAVATGDGMAMAYRAGAELRDLEFMQFHPTVLYIAGSSRSLITEAIRGEGAYLVDRNGYRFMADYDERGELAPRDIVSQSIVTQMEKTRHANVCLDLSHLDPDFVRARFPGIAATCAQFGLDITTDRIPVRPGAHYMVGGVTVDKEGRTSLPALWAAGEVSSTGLHGANRLASNSLLENLVYGTHAGQGASLAAGQMPDDYQACPLDNPPIDEQQQSLDLSDIRNALKAVMWRAAGVRRTGHDLKEAMKSIEHWQQYVAVSQFCDPLGWELQNMLTISQIIVRAALQREESRGVHLRTDFPQLDDEHWLRRISVQR